jgi:hypothetical protein
MGAPDAVRSDDRVGDRRLRPLVEMGLQQLAHQLPPLAFSSRSSPLWVIHAVSDDRSRTTKEEKLASAAATLVLRRRRSHPRRSHRCGRSLNLRPASIKVAQSAHVEALDLQHVWKFIDRSVYLMDLRPSELALSVYVWLPS